MTVGPKANINYYTYHHANCYTIKDAYSYFKFKYLAFEAIILRKFIDTTNIQN